MNIVIIGLTITSSWGNGHATTYRGLVRELCRRGHRVLFLEHDKPWYASNRDMPQPPFGTTRLYTSIEQLTEQFGADIANADLVIVGSYVPEGVDVGRFVTNVAEGITAFYDIDTPITLSKLTRGDLEYLSTELIPKYDLYLSFTGGPTLRRLEKDFDSSCARPLYCSVDPALYFAEKQTDLWELAYLGTYSDDRQPALKRLLLDVALARPGKLFAVAGPQYPASIDWPANVDRVEHLAPAKHRHFYNAQRFTLNLTRADMVRAGYSPSVRLFEAAACGAAIISDWWEGLDQFFEPGRDILIADNTEDVLRILRDTSNDERRQIGSNARSRVLARHTAEHRAIELEGYVREVSAKQNHRQHAGARS